MSKIRRQSILSTLVIYFGFFIGMINTYLFTKQGIFTPDQYGLTSAFLIVAMVMSSLANFASSSYLVKFYPYYNDRLPPQKNDMLSIVLLVNLIGFLFIIILGILFKGLVIQKLSENSPIVVYYYFWLFPFGFGFTLYAVLETYLWLIGKPLYANFLKEVAWRILISILISLFAFGVIKDFKTFVTLFSFTFIALAIMAFLYLRKSGKFYILFKPSIVTKKFIKKIIPFCLFIYSSTFIFNFSFAFDTFVILSVLDNGAAKAGVFGLSQLLTAIIQAPQRAIITVSVPAISQAWKDKNIGIIQKIYERSSINQIIFSLGIFLLIILNYHDAINTLNIQGVFLQGYQVFIFLGIAKIVDMGTGVNSQIITTSNFWKFDLISGIVLLVVMMPLTYFLAYRLDIVGPAIATLISTIIYNTIRIIFLWKKFKLFPFTRQSLYTFFPALVAFLAAYFLFKNHGGLVALFARSIAFIIIYAGLVYYLKLSPDVEPILQTLQKRVKRIFGK